MSTKAEVLKLLQSKLVHSCVMDLYYFTEHSYRQDRTGIVNHVMRLFGPVRLAVRSSAQIEDGAHNSMAGVFTSCLNVDGADAGAIAESIEKVAASFRGDPNDQILIQPMIKHIEMSGVVMTRDIDHGSPYYVINYDDETGSPDSVTGGTRVNKTVLIFRHCAMKRIRSERLRRVIKMVKEIESHYPGVPLDIEFALSQNKRLYAMQIRRMAVASKWDPSIEQAVSDRLEYVDHFVRSRSQARSGIAGQKTILGEMPDWNPAEIIGTTPRPLAASLYREIVTRSIWREAREMMGYRRMPAEELMVMVGGRPFIDVRRAYDAIMPINSMLSILQCTAAYPAPPELLNLRVITTFREHFPDVVVGFSDHENGIALAVAAYMLGSRIHEQHFTLNHTWKGTDHAFSLEPIGMQKLVRDLRRARVALGDGIKAPLPCEAKPLYKMAKKLVAARNLSAGHRITRADVAIKSPGDGLPPYELDSILGRQLRRSLKKDESFSLHLLRKR